MVVEEVKTIEISNLKPTTVIILYLKMDGDIAKRFKNNFC